jgi:hypothetical protein
VNRSKGITFVALDRSRALTEQGPYDAILHKVGLVHMIPWKTSWKKLVGLVCFVCFCFFVFWFFWFFFGSEKCSFLICLLL